MYFFILSWVGDGYFVVIVSPNNTVKIEMKYLDLKRVFFVTIIYSIVYFAVFMFVALTFLIMFIAHENISDDDNKHK